MASVSPARRVLTLLSPGVRRVILNMNTKFATASAEELLQALFPSGVLFFQPPACSILAPDPPNPLAGRPHLYNLPGGDAPPSGERRRRLALPSGHAADGSARARAAGQEAPVRPHLPLRLPSVLVRRARDGRRVYAGAAGKAAGALPSQPHGVMACGRSFASAIRNALC